MDLKGRIFEILFSLLFFFEELHADLEDLQKAGVVSAVDFLSEHGDLGCDFEVFNDGI